MNTARAYAYARQAGIPLRTPGCNITGATYTTAAADDAPWYDPNVPESARVFGFAGAALNGLDRVPHQRAMAALPNGGGRLAGLATVHRQMTAEVIALAADDAALSYAIAWLSRAAADPPCSPSCRGQHMQLAAHCLDAARPDENPLRTLYEVGLLEGPVELSRFKAGQCGIGARLELTLAAGLPWLYRPPTPVQTVTLATQPTVTFNPNPTAVCSTPGTCMDDPACLPPQIPPAPRPANDPCWLGGSTFTARRTVVTLPATALPTWLEAVPIIRVQSGTAPLKKVWIRLYDPALAGCGDPLDPCTRCAEWSAMYLAANTILDIDVRSRTAMAVCGGDITTAFEPVLYGPGGDPPGWPTVGCSPGVCVEIAAESAGMAANASVSVSFAARQDAA
ncbi:hypothetical protein ACQEVF_57390 [Nonomuraea polychroma]|uniref:hypothetical protein n=1 Tax=Nonomuraea polychroma TaxID=46176 RepID=UPI003D92763C